MPEGSSSLIEEAGLSETSAGGMEIGLYTFGELISNPHTGHMISAQQRVREIIAAAQLADEAGLDVFGQAERTTWRGRFRPALENAEVSPRPMQPRLPVWIGAGGTPRSVARAGALGLPIVLAIIGGAPARVRPLVDLYHQAGAQAGHAPGTLKVAARATATLGRRGSRRYGPSTRITPTTLGTRCPRGATCTSPPSNTGSSPAPRGASS